MELAVSAYRLMASVILLAAAGAGAQDSTQSVSTAVAGTRSHAVDLTVAALTAHSYSIETASEYAVTTAPSSIRGGWSKYRLVAHAALTAVGTDSVRVVLSAIATSIGSPVANFAPPQAPVTIKQKAEYRELQEIRNDIGAAAATAK
jgi:hypothetical protein